MEMVRYCANCDDEFRADVLVCSDCGGSLVLQPEGAGAKGVAESHSIDPDVVRASLDDAPISSLVPIKTFDSLTDLEPAVATLAEAGIQTRVLVQNGRYLLLLRPESLGDAQTALEAVHLEEGSDQDVEAGFDPSTGRYAACPACATPLPDRPSDCPECGLELGGAPSPINPPEAD